MSKDVNIHVKTPGARDGKRQLDDVAKSAAGVGDKTRQAGAQAASGSEKGAKGIDGLSQSASSARGVFAKFFSSITSWAAGLVGITAIIGAVTKAIRINKQTLEEHAEIAERQQKKLLALQGMGTFFEEHPEARKEVAAFAEFGRRPFEEVAQAWYALESKGAGLTKKQKRGIMTEALELGRLEPESSLESIIEVFSLYAKETRQKDINLVQNILRSTLSQAGANLSELAQQFTKFLPVGVGGGLTGAETAGIWAYATTRTGAPEQATTGLRNIFASLRGKGTPESMELLGQLGITPDMGFFQQLAGLAMQKRAGRFGVPEAEIIAGKENFSLLLSMLTDPQAMMETIRSVTSKARPGIDITRAKLDEIMGIDEVARIEEEVRRKNIQIENIKATDINALKWKLRKREAEITAREAGDSELSIAYDQAMAGLVSGMGLPAPPPEAEAAALRQNITIVNDYGQKFYPRVGDDLQGPRYSQE